MVMVAGGFVVVLVKIVVVKMKMVGCRGGGSVESLVVKMKEWNEGGGMGWWLVLVKVEMKMKAVVDVVGGGGDSGGSITSCQSLGSIVKYFKIYGALLVFVH